MHPVAQPDSHPGEFHPVPLAPPLLMYNLDPEFTRITTGPHIGKWKCIYCPNGRSLLDRAAHLRSSTHQDRKRLATPALPPTAPPGLTTDYNIDSEEDSDSVGHASVCPDED